jgi:hypothetical protein|tara:strand:+ start:406 stop:642 length:237 start_codon:yes stop_codon:yes gene_type:complete
MTTIYAPTPENPLTTTQKIRNKRLFILKDCDWTVGIDSPLTDAKKAEWATYRQTLRDLPAEYSDSDNFDDVVFPTQPE